MKPENQIFLIEDDVKTKEQIERIIQNHFPDLELVWAKTKEEVREKWHSLFRCTIADYVIKNSRLTGVQIIQKLQKDEGIEQPIISCTADLADEIDDLAKHFPGCRAYLNKLAVDFEKRLVEEIERCVYTELEQKIFRIESESKELGSEFLERPFHEIDIDNLAKSHTTDLPSELRTVNKELTNEKVIRYLNDDTIPNVIKETICQILSKNIFLERIRREKKTMIREVF